MKRSKIAMLLKIDSSYISHAVNGKYKNTTTRKINELLDFELKLAEYLTDPLFNEILDLAILHAKVSQTQPVRLAVDLKRLRDIVLDKSGRSLTDKPRNGAYKLHKVLADDEEIIERYFCHDSFKDMCEIAIAKAKQSNKVKIREFASDMIYLSESISIQ